MGKSVFCAHCFLLALAATELVAAPWVRDKVTAAVPALAEWMEDSLEIQNPDTVLNLTDAFSFQSTFSTSFNPHSEMRGGWREPSPPPDGK